MGAVSENIWFMNNVGQIILLGIGILFTLGIVCTFISLFETDIVEKKKEPVYTEKYFDNDDAEVIIIEQDESTDAINNYYS